MTTQQDPVREALIAAREWLAGWASAEPYLSRIDAALALPVQPAEPVAPHGYAYRYHDIGGGTVIRFNHGGEVNGSRSIEAVPFWLGAPPSPSPASAGDGMPPTLVHLLTGFNPEDPGLTKPDLDAIKDRASRRWADLQAAASDEKTGYVWIHIKTPKDTLEVRVTKSGLMRIYLAERKVEKP